MSFNGVKSKVAGIFLAMDVALSATPTRSKPGATPHPCAECGPWICASKKQRVKTERHITISEFCWGCDLRALGMKNEIYESLKYRYADLGVL